MVGAVAEQGLDQTDLEILELLAENARRTLGDLAIRVNMSASAVKRRIDRLEKIRVITGYTVTVDYSKAGRPIQAFTEVRYIGATDLEEIKATAAEMPEVQSVYATAGEPDALVRLRVSDIDRLGEAIERLRSSGRVIGTKTLVVLDTWSRHREVANSA